MLNKFNGLIARSNMRVEERRKMRFERNPDKEWRLRRQRHMRRFAVAMRRNVQIVHGLRQRDQSPVL
ncbi:hypothetical protein BDY24DRAFT_386907 [Mrakia frigida]|uniref:uncharacterized protein n=1 Tax=Mrakia frigida TaxID=29902 RepID=UPI003FCC0FAA